MFLHRALIRVVSTIFFISTILLLSLPNAEPVKAATGGSITLNQSTFDATFSFNANDNDSYTGAPTSEDFIFVVCYNANGQVSDVDFFSIPTGGMATIGTECSNIGSPFTPRQGPLSVQLWDVGDLPAVGCDPFNLNENSMECFDLARSGTLLASFSGIEKPLFTDGRCNPDPEASVVFYSDGKGGYNFYAIYQSVGYFTMHITKAQLDAKPDKGENYLIIQKKGIQLYRLAGGLLQVNRIKPDGKYYTFIWERCTTPTPGATDE
jgi:hypothetical protein